eukprot:COSAG06_NODE_178_length_20949_cov_26.114053_7_plen_587_part_00
MPYQPIIEHYDDGAPIQDDNGVTPNPKAQAYKDASRDYKRMLRKEYYDEDNPRGANSLYYILKVKHPDDGNHPRAHPPKRYVSEWISRQGKTQVFKKKKGKAKSIQSVILSKPNDLIQVDYVYFFRNIAPSVIISDEDDLSAADKKKLKEQDKDFSEFFGKGKVQYRGAITAIDCFSRFAYVVPIAGPVNSTTAKAAMEKIIKEAEKRYDRRVSRIQTDKGSEFMKDFRKYLKDRKAQHPSHYSHVFGFEGRSHSQAIVERFNGTFRRMMTAVLGKSLFTPDWTDKYKKVLKNYNATPHTTLSSKSKWVDVQEGDGSAQSPIEIKKRQTNKKLIAPADITDDKDDDPTWKEVARNIVDHSIKSDTAQDPVYKVGDYVRIRIFKPNKDTPSFSFKKGPLWELRKDAGQSSEEFQGVYMITGVRGGKSGKVARAPTYTIVARWSKEQTPDWYAANQEEDGTLPSGVSNPSDADRTIDVAGSLFDGKVYKAPAYPRRFLKEELLRVRQTKKGIPIVDWGETKDGKKKTGSDVLDMDEGETIEEYVVEKIVKYTDKKKTKVEVKWKGYTDTTVEPVKQVSDTQAFKDFSS